MAVVTRDPWLVPARQCELPGRDLVAAAVLHARRESMFLAFASLVLTATIALPLFVHGTVVDLGTALRLEQPVELTFGVVVFPVALIVSHLICEIFGARRTFAVALAAVLASTSIFALAVAAGHLTPVALPLALVTYSAVAHATNALVFSGLRRALRGYHLILRSLLSIAVAQVIGELAFLFVMSDRGQDVALARTIALVAALYTCGIAAAAALPLWIARRVLGVYVRVGRTEDFAIDHSAGQAVVSRRKLPPAVIVDDETGEPAPRRAARSSLQPFTHSEIAFFREGEELS